MAKIQPPNNFQNLVRGFKEQIPSIKRIFKDPQALKDADGRDGNLDNKITGSVWDLYQEHPEEFGNGNQE